MSSQCRRFEGKVAIVSGGADGMGAAWVEQLGIEGARVFALDVKHDMAKALAKKLNAQGGKVEALRADVMNEEEFKAALATAIGTEARVDVLINIAGGSAGGLIAEIDLEVWD